MSGQAPTGAFADRLSQKPADTTAPPKPSTTDWADEVASPTEEKSAPIIEQLDGATVPRGGSQIQETEKSVMVTLNPDLLAKMQADPNNPLYSAADSFEKVIR